MTNDIPILAIIWCTSSPIIHEYFSTIFSLLIYYRLRQYQHVVGFSLGNPRTYVTFCSCESAVTCAHLIHVETCRVRSMWTRQRWSLPLLQRNGLPAPSRQPSAPPSPSPAFSGRPSSPPTSTSRLSETRMWVKFCPNHKHMSCYTTLDIRAVSHLVKRV